jgi:hypothetical protein
MAYVHVGPCPVERRRVLHVVMLPGWGSGILEPRLSVGSVGSSTGRLPGGGRAVVSGDGRRPPPVRRQHREKTRALGANP